MEYGVQHELHAASSGPDDKIRPGYGLGETLARLSPYPFNAEQKHCGKGYGQDDEAERAATVPGASRRQFQ
jgi:hypothetical protein